MSIDYLVLGGVLIVMGAVQTWMRHGSWAKEPGEAATTAAEEETAAVVDAAVADAAVEDATADEEAVDGGAVDEEAAFGPDPGAVKAGRRSGKVWGAWTAILGPVSMALGIVLVVLGVLGH
jgi:hypothetical protein